MSGARNSGLALLYNALNVTDARCDSCPQTHCLCQVSSCLDGGLQVCLLVRSNAGLDHRQKAQLDYMQALINAGNAGNITVHVGYQTKLLTS